MLRATVELLGKTGYADLSVDAIAKRAGTSKPAIYRRWPSKAHLVHEAVFPIGEATELPDTGSLAGDVREMVRRSTGVLTTPAARAAMPGLLAEMATDPTLHAKLLERFGDITSRGMTDRLDDAVERGEVRPDVTAADLVEAIAGIDPDGDHHPQPRTRRRLGGAHRHPDHERNQRMTARSSPRPHGGSCWKPLAGWIARSSTGSARSPTTGTSPTATACSRRRWASHSTPTCSPTRAGRGGSRSTRRRGSDRRWGGDNTDAYYFMCPVDPKRRYRISGNKGDSVYFSVTAYNEPSPGAWSDRIVAIVRDDDLDIDADGNFSFELGPTPDAAVLMTRDYQADPQTGRPVSWHIEALDEPDPFRHGDAETAAQLRASAAWMRTMFAILPLAVGRAGRGCARARATRSRRPQTNSPIPTRCRDANFGWSARDACYAYGSFVLEDDEALVITHRPPQCRFWNLVVWNQFMATPGVTDARSSVNGHSAVPNADGSVTVVLSRGMTAHPNSLTTLDYPLGNLAFRWFLADEVPARPEVQLVKVGRRADDCGLTHYPVRRCVVCDN